MAESSRSRVTITLGRSGQVVKRPGLVQNESSVPYSQPSVGTKRSIQDRLGNYADPDMLLNNKRQVRDGSRSSLSVSDDSDDVTLTKDDLRFKIMRKSSSQSSIQQKGGVDLRDLLSRPAHSTTTRIREHMPVLRNTKDQIPEQRHVRPPMPMPMPKKTDRQLLAESGDNRQKVPAPRDYESTRYPGPGPNGSSSFSQVRPSSSTKAMPDLDSLRHAYSPWTLDSLRKRSPDNRLASTSRGLSPPRRIEESDRRPPSRSYDDSRASSVLTKYGLDHPNSSMYPSAYAAKALQTAVASKMMLPPPVTQLHSSAAPVQRNPYPADQYSVDAFLHSLGLDKYSINFKAEEVDMFALRRMGDHDLKDLGIPMGPRKKILLTLLAQAKRQL